MKVCDSLARRKSLTWICAAQPSGPPKAFRQLDLGEPSQQIAKQCFFQPVRDGAVRQAAGSGRLAPHPGGEALLLLARSKELIFR